MEQIVAKKSCTTCHTNFTVTEGDVAAYRTFGFEPGIRAKAEEFRLKHPHLAMLDRRSENCFGNYLFDTKNSYYCFKGHDLEDCFYVYNSGKLRDCVDSGLLFKSELIYKAIEATENYNCNFLYWCAHCRDCEYIMYCFDCSDCFGCFNLKKKKYHILNQPYEKTAYFELVGLIKEQLQANDTSVNFLPDVAGVSS